VFVSAVAMESRMQNVRGETVQHQTTRLKGESQFDLGLVSLFSQSRQKQNRMLRMGLEFAKNLSQSNLNLYNFFIGLN
jgi:hypothetical protein